MKQHKWHKEIKAWADGAEIEMKMKDGNWINIKDYWEDIESPIWYENEEYRIKPQPKEPQYLYVYQTGMGIEFGFPGQVYPVKSHRDRFECIGKIKLEQDDE